MVQNKPCGLHKVLKINQVVWLGWRWAGFKINHVGYLGAPRVRAGRAEQEGSKAGSEAKGK